MPADLADALDGVVSAVDARERDLIDVRRDLHAHPELGFHEERTTRVVAGHLAAAGLAPG